jgi:hypothetical protein
MIWKRSGNKLEVIWKRTGKIFLWLVKFILNCKSTKKSKLRFLF